MKLETMICRMIDQLRDELKRVDAAITRLLVVQVVGKPKPKRRGRKSMSTAERVEVSVRMRNYWAARRAEREVCIVVPVGVTVTRSFEDLLLRAAAAKVVIDGNRRLFYLHGTRCERLSLGGL
jgi:sugar-specific transcriptional regulator TrmB